MKDIFKQTTKQITNRLLFLNRSGFNPIQDGSFRGWSLTADFTGKLISRADFTD